MKQQPNEYRPHFKCECVILKSIDSAVYCNHIFYILDGSFTSTMIISKEKKGRSRNNSHLNK